MDRNEQDLRKGILNTLLTTPHRELAKIYPVHQEMIKQDPLFYSHLGAWYFDNGDVRDHKEMFCVNLCLSTFEGHRDAGLAMLRQLPPYQVARVVDFVHGRRKTRVLHDKKTKTVSRKVEKLGLSKVLPGSMKTEIKNYLRERENDPNWFDGSVLTARKFIKRLYKLIRLAPSERAQKILFDREPPPDSRLFQLKELHNAKTPADQAKVIIENKIPYRVASNVVDVMTPTVLFALIEVMSDQDLINSLGALRRKGALDNPDLKKVIEGRLEKAKTGKRVAAMKHTAAIKASGVSEDIQKQLEDIADTQIKARGRIKKPTALLIDKSGSMQKAIEVGKRVAAMISAIMEADLYVYAFDTIGYKIKSESNDLASWEKAFHGIIAGGGTSCGAGLLWLSHAKQVAEQIIMISDQGENTPPAFLKSLQEYQKQFGVEPNVVFVNVPDLHGRMHHEIEEKCKRAEFQVDSWDFGGDYYSLPNLIPFLTKPSTLELLMDIMSYPLPVRKMGV